jgi:mannose-6-phosphate isomerase-like protein (cupin superfamily)
MSSALPVTVIRGNSLPFVPASHEDSVSPGVLKRVLFPKKELPDGRVQMLNWAVMPGKKSFRPHYHEDMDEIFVIMTGHVRVTVEGNQYELASGDAIRIPAGCVHTMTNPEPDVVTYVVVGISSGKNGKTITLA